MRNGTTPLKVSIMGASLASELMTNTFNLTSGVIRPFTPHDLRRTFAGEMLDAGVDLVTVQHLIGHASPITTSRYDRRDEKTKMETATEIHFPMRGN